MAQEDDLDDVIGVVMVMVVVSGCKGGRGEAPLSESCRTALLVQGFPTHGSMVGRVSKFLVTRGQFVSSIDSTL